MADWADLHREVTRLDFSERRRIAERDLFEKWCVATEDRVLLALATRAGSRARELEQATGASVRVSTSGIVRGETAPGPDLRARFRTVSLELGSSRVDVYSVRAVSESPCIHLGVLRGATGFVRFPVMASIPGCLVVRREDGGFALQLPFPLPIEASRPAPEPPTTSIDAIVLRAFELLVGAHQSTRAASSRAS